MPDATPLVIRLVETRRVGRRLTIGVFVGRRATTLQLAGTLELYCEEATLLGAALEMGAEQTQGHLVVEVEGMEPPEQSQPAAGVMSS